MSADTTLYNFSVDGLSAGTFAVLSFVAEEALSTATSFQTVVVSKEKGLSREEMVGKEAVFSIHVNGEHALHGIVAEFHEEPFTDVLSRYEIVVKSRLELMNFGAHCRIFQGRTAPQILTALLEEAGVDPKSYKLALTGTYPALDMRVQYNETDFAFFSRTAEAVGIFHFEEIDDDDVVLVLADDNFAFPPSRQTDPLEYRPGAGLVERTYDAMYSLRRSNSLQRGKARFSGYDYEQPGAVQRGSNGTGNGEWTRHETGAKSAAELTDISRRVRESDNISHDRVTCTTHNPMLRAGGKFSISQQFGWGFGGDYVAVSVLHEGSQEGSVLGSGADSHYTNRVVAQPIALPFRPAMSTARPRIPGVLVAKVDGPDGPYAHLDDAGRYRARFPFDESSKGPGEATPPLRLSQPYAGPGYGLHLPLHKGSDLVLAFEDGNIDKPVALGALPNPSQKSPVAAGNKSQSVLKSATGNQLLLDDQGGKTRVVLQSSTGQQLFLDDVPDTAGALLQTVHKHRLLLDDKNDTLELSVSDGAHSLKILSEKGILTLRTKSGHFLKLDDDKKAVSLQTAGGHLLKLDDNGGQVTLQDGKGKHVVQIDAGGGISLTTEGDLQLSAKGSLKMKAKDVSIQSDSGAIDVKSAQALNLQGMNANLKADQNVAIQAGMEAGLKAGTNLQLEGTINVESKAGVANKMTGVMTNVESSAINTIKGAMVMIN
jgi:type VI secretion system secreted protein VgrG